MAFFDTIKIPLLSLLLGTIIFPFHTRAQELNCRVELNTDQVQQADITIFQDMKENIRNFMNDQIWTDDKFLARERITCTILITITKIDGNQFQASFQVQSGRPVYGTSYQTTILDYLDENVKFKYVQFQRLNYIEGSFTSNLVSLLSYYAYMILGFDYDTFSKTGGSEFFKEAEKIATYAQGQGDNGWSASSSDPNRYTIVEQILDPRFEKFREALYQYHRLGLDVMSDDTRKGRKAIFESIQKLKKVEENKPNSFLMHLSFRAKSREIGNVFSEASMQQKQKVLEILTSLDPSNMDKYRKAIKQ